MSARNFTLTFLGGETRRVTRGSTFLMRSASAPVTVKAVNIRDADGAIRGDTLEFTNVTAGFKVRPLPAGRYFEGLEIYSASANTVEIVVGDEEVEISGTMSVVTSPASAFTTAAVTVGVAAVLVAALNAARKRVTVQSLQSNGANIYLGATSGVTTANGLELVPGASVEIENIADVYAISGTAAQGVRVMEEL